MAVRLAPLLILIASTAFPAEPLPDGRTLLEKLEVRASEIRDIESGEVLTKLASEYEQSPRELAIDAAVVIRKPLEELVSESRDSVTLLPDKLILDSGILDETADFSGLEFDDSEGEEAQLWLNARPKDDLNLGAEDFELIARLRDDRGDRSDLELASEAVRQVLRRRFTAYLEGGLAAIEPYQRKRRKTVDVGGELRLSNEQLFAIEDHFPDYYDTLVNFPATHPCCEHEFMWLKGRFRKRPTFILVHKISLIDEDVMLLTERQIYVSHSLNSLQLTLGWLPYESEGEDTYLGIATSASSDYLTGIVGKMIRVLGANKGAEMVGDVLADIRDDLEAGKDPRAQD